MTRCLRFDLCDRPASAGRLLTLLVWLTLYAAPARRRQRRRLRTSPSAFELLQGRSFKDKGQAVELIASSGHARSKAILGALLESRLYVKKDDTQLGNCRTGQALPRRLER